MGAPFEFRLAADALEWRKGTYAGRTPYDRIRRIRLSFRPMTMQNYRFLTEVWVADGPKLQIASTSWKSIFEHERFDAAYRTFVTELARRAGAAGGRASFDTGSPALLYWPGVVVFIGASLALAALFVRALQEAAWSGAAFIAAFLGLFFWQAACSSSATGRENSIRHRRPAAGAAARMKRSKVRTPAKDSRMPRYDVVVVGLGAFGSAATYQLAKRGAKVLGIDRFSPPHALGSTHGETRITRMAIGEGAEYSPLALRSRLLWQQIERENAKLPGHDGDEALFNQCGCLTIFGPRSTVVHHGVKDFFANIAKAARKHKVKHKEFDSGAQFAPRFPSSPSATTIAPSWICGVDICVPKPASRRSFASPRCGSGRACAAA